MSRARFRPSTSHLLLLLSASLLSFTLACDDDGLSTPRWDIVSPTVVSAIPADGATGVPVGQVVAVTFSEAMNPATLTTATLKLAGPGATPVSGTVTYDAATMTARLTPAGSLAVSTTYTATITTGAADLAGHGLVSNTSWSFSTGPFVDTSAPVVIATTPVAGANGVATNTTVSGTFNEPMNPATLTTATFGLVGPGATPVPGAVAYDAATRVTTFTPTSALAASTSYTATITTGARDVAGNPLATNKTWSFTTGTAADTTAPTVLSTVPANGATGVNAGQVVTATFSEAMNAATLTSATFTLRGPGMTPVTGVVSYDPLSHVASFSPMSSLAGSTTFTATITTGAQDVAGNALATNKVWTFTTGAAADVIAPTVITTVPADGAVAVPTNQVVSAQFSEPMNAPTINATTFRLAGPGATPVAGTVTYNPVTRVASFTPASSLAPSTLFTATITTGVTDAAGNALASNEVWSFTTGFAGDVIAPTVISTIPVHGATGVPRNQVVTATFSEPMNPATITNATYTLAGPGATPVAGAVSYDAPTRTASFTPTSLLAASTTYTATITTAVRDLAGNAMAVTKTWSFTTGVAADVLAPTVVSTIPVNGAVGVPTNQVVRATFSEPMNPATLTTGSFTLTGPGATPVAGAVSYDALTRTASFTPTSALASSTLHVATITTDATDAAGNPLATNATWSFTTGIAPDTLAPTVISTIPVDGSTGAPINQVVRATFSEAMNVATISTMSFTLAGPAATPVTGLVTYDVPTRVASFTPSSDLLPSTMYTATITTAVRDLAGNPMAADEVWTFRTENQPSVPLGDVGSYAVLAGSTVTNTGPTHLVGDLGVSPGTAVTGFPPGTLTGTIHAGDPAAAQAKSDLTAAYNDAAGRSDAPITISGNLGGMTLAPGLYKSTSSLAISSGNLTLDALGDSNAVFIFQMASTLTTTPGRAVILAGGAKANNVFWQVGTSATLGTGTSFKGTIMADQSITLNTGASLEGRAVTRIGAVTMASNSIVVPSP